MNRIKEERAAAGLCTRCGAPLDTDGRTCSACREKSRLKQAESRQYYRLHNVCPECRKETIFNTEKMCPECRAKIATRTAARKEKMTKEQKDLERQKVLDSNNRLRAKRKADGICVMCGKRNAQKDRIHCSICSVKHKEQSRESYRKCNEVYIPRYERAAYGLCYICGKQLDCKSSLCKKCMDKAIANLELGRYKSAYYRAGNSWLFHKTDVKKTGEIGKIQLELKDN